MDLSNTLKIFVYDEIHINEAPRASAVWRRPLIRESLTVFKAMLTIPSFQARPPTFLAAMKSVPRTLRSAFIDSSFTTEEVYV